MVASSCKGGRLGATPMRGGDEADGYYRESGKFKTRPAMVARRKRAWSKSAWRPTSNGGEADGANATGLAGQGGKPAWQPCVRRPDRGVEEEAAGESNVRRARGSYGLPRQLCDVVKCKMMNQEGNGGDGLDGQEEARVTRPKQVGEDLGRRVGRRAGRYLSRPNRP